MVKVTENPKDVVPADVLASAIRDISIAAKKLAASGLNRRAIVLLIAESSKVSRNAVNAVLDSLESLERDYCKR